MTWQKRARLAIAAFVLVFAAIVAVALWQRKPPAVATDNLPKRIDETSFSESPGGGVFETFKDGKVAATVRFASEITYADGRSKLRGVTVTLPDRNGRTVEIRGNEVEITGVKGGEIGTAHFTGDVKLTTSDGIEVTATEATYNDSDGTLQVPGPIAFKRDRMQGTGVGATYDRNRDVLWLLDQAHVTVAPDEKGEGALDAVAGSAGLARGENYLRLTKNARITAEGRTVEGDDITILLTDDGKRARMAQLRGNSRIAGEGQGSQALSARDIDLTYAEDGKSLQFAKLIESATVQLPAVGTTPGRRVVANAIDIAMAPDGTTVTNLTAKENVEVDLPAERDLPARRIRSETLAAEGTAGTGLQSATFTGAVEYRETRAAGRNLPAVDRTARALRLIVATDPGLGAIQLADFRGQVHFTDGAEIIASAPRALYRVDQGRVDLSMSEGDPGPTPNLADGQMSTVALNIGLTLDSRKLNADTKVRSSLQPRRKSDASSASRNDAGRVPSVLKQDEPVNITANRLAYDGASVATYSGSAQLWQGDTAIRGETITLDDKNGNLAAQGDVRTQMTFEEVDQKSKQRKTTRTNGRAESFVYEDEKRQATYTTNARISGVQGDLAADRIELFLKDKANELDRVEGYGKVTLKDQTRTFTGERFTYTAPDDRMAITGKPAEVIEETPPNCRKTIATTITYERATERMAFDGRGQSTSTTPIHCGSERRF